MLRSRTENDRLTVDASHLLRRIELGTIGQLNAQPITASTQRSRQKIHGRRANETGHELVGRERCVEAVIRCALSCPMAPSSMRRNRWPASTVSRSFSVRDLSI